MGKTQYAVFDNGDRGLVSYDDPQAICDKVEYANERGMAGFLIWEISGDMIDLGGGQISTPLADVTNDKIRDPGLVCSTRRDPLWALKDATRNVAPPEPAEADWTGYVAPSGGGSANDFNGAVEFSVSIPAPSPSAIVSPSLNTVYDDPAVPPVGAGSRGGDDCPPELTGYFPLPGCEQYVYCQSGSMVGAPLPCVPGTLFDAVANTCNFEENVSC